MSSIEEVYCMGCPEVCIGHTGRYVRRKLPAVAERFTTTGQDWSGQSKVLDRENREYPNRHWKPFTSKRRKLARTWSDGKWIRWNFYITKSNLYLQEIFKTLIWLNNFLIIIVWAVCKTALFLRPYVPDWFKPYHYQFFWFINYKALLDYFRKMCGSEMCREIVKKPQKWWNSGHSV